MAANYSNLNRYRELPISVQSAWEGYDEIAQAIDQLTQAGNYYSASLLTQALFSDDRVSACLNTRTNAIFGLPMDFKYPGQDEPEDDSTPEQIALKQHIRDTIEAEWEDILPGASARELHRWGVMMNLGAAQLFWRWHDGDEDLEPEGILLPTLNVWNTQFCYWRWDTRSFWVNHLGGTAEIHPGDGNWVLFCPFGHNHGWLYGLINSLGWLYLDRIFLKRNWARANEKWSLGVIKCFVPPDADAGDKQNFTDAIQNMPHEAAVLLPVTKSGNKFDLETLKTDSMTGADNFAVSKKAIDIDIAIDILGQNLSTEISGSGSSGSGGSRAAAKVHNDIREDILKADVEILQTTIKTQILTPMVQMNWGHKIAELGGKLQDFVPDVTWQIEPPEDKAQDTQAISALAEALPVLNAAGVDIAALLERFDIPMIEGKLRRTRPSPDGDSYERPGLPGWGLDQQAAMLENLTPPAPPADDVPDGRGGTASGEKEEQLSRAHLDGFKLKGQLAVDALTKGLTRELKAQMAPTVGKLTKIIQSSDGYSERRKKIVELYRDWDPKDVRAILQRAMIAANLIGRVASAAERAN